jgi:hypothetical protein
MIIKELKNPLTQQYYSFKNIISGTDFPWFYSTTTRYELATPYFAHPFVQSPEKNSPIPKINYQYFDIVIQILKDIQICNDLNINCFLRICANYTFNWGGGFACDPHHDHKFPHKNLLIYLNQSSGPTVVINPENNSEEYFHPKEDSIILFEGMHYHYQPNVGEKRMVLVATYI